MLPFSIVQIPFPCEQNMISSSVLPNHLTNVSKFASLNGGVWLLKFSLRITSTWDVIGVRLKVGLVKFPNGRDDIEIVFIGDMVGFWQGDVVGLPYAIRS